ncbi:MAG: TrkH family potassium uptake protein [Candidatus Limiplasma sp.]|nr:TrkH family potassium uptake protein [Candidatus Limiplasma sp.]
MKQNRMKCSSIGKFLILTGILIALPLLTLPFYPQECQYASAYYIPAIGSAVIGLLICIFRKDSEDASVEWQTSMQRSSLTVLFVWGWGILAGALPFILGEQLRWVQAAFESVSGWTTTGLSVMDVTVTPHIYLFHRSFMQFCGGLGFILMMMLLVQGKQSMNLYNAEGHPDKLKPNLRKTAQTIVFIYGGFLIAGTAAYVVAGMNLFESLCHAMCSLSTGGFSTKLNSIGEYASLPIEAVTIVLMLIGTTNFAVLQLLVTRKWKQAGRVSELRFMFLLLILFVPVVAFSLINNMGMSWGEGFRRALFDTSSALSTTGYSSMSYTNWPPLAVGVLILMMLIGGGIGSTAGGIKLSRVYIIIRAVWQNVQKRFLPARSVQTSLYYKAQGRTIIDTPLVADTLGFVGSYMLLYIIGSLLMTITANSTLVDALFEFASALGTVGLSIGLTGPTTNNATLWVEMAGMILGRLEIFIILIGLYSGFSVIRRGVSSRWARE